MQLNSLENFKPHLSLPEFSAQVKEKLNVFLDGKSVAQIVQDMDPLDFKQWRTDLFSLTSEVGGGTITRLVSDIRKFLDLKVSFDPNADFGDPISVHPEAKAYIAEYRKEFHETVDFITKDPIFLQKVAELNSYLQKIEFQQRLHKQFPNVTYLAIESLDFDTDIADWNCIWLVVDPASGQKHVAVLRHSIIELHGASFIQKFVEYHKDLVSRLETFLTKLT